MAKTIMDKIVPLYDAVMQHTKEYSAGGADYSATTLLRSPRQVHLQKRHGHKVKPSVEEQLSSFIGTAVHNYIEQMLKKCPNKDRYICEERMHIEVAGRDISGAYDIIFDKLGMYDIKTTSTWHYIFGGVEDWEKQQNIYRYMYKQIHGIEIKHLNIIGIYLDFSKYQKMKYGKKYPSHKAMQHKLKVWPYAKTRRYLELQVENLKAYEDTPDDDLPSCTKEDMWADDDVWAVHAKRRKSALRLTHSEVQAREWVVWYLNSKNCKYSLKQLYVQKRPGTRKRCESWCPINKYCNQYHAYNKEDVN